MAPQSRKRKSEALEETPQPHTPTGSPARKKLKITETQKQALIDNLQLEITERARHLRAHYALQCADLRSRIERRINRIPIAMRKMTMGELMEKHTAATKPQPTRIPSDTNKTLPPLPHEQPAKPISPVRPNIQAPAGRGKKRKSSDIQIASDKENDGYMAPDSLPVTKKTRGKAGPTRTASRTAKPANILSPRSHNSRTLPRSPIKEPTSPNKSTSPAKSFIARPISPLKPASPLKSAATAATSAISAAAHGMMEHAKRGAATAGKLSRTASREKTTTTVISATSTAKGKMLPPPRPAPSVPSSPQRTASASTTSSGVSDASTASTANTVITKPTRAGRTAKHTKATANSSPVAAKKATAAGRVTKSTAVAKTALKTNTKTANKKVVVAEPAIGRRVLRKRN